MSKQHTDIQDRFDNPMSRLRRLQMEYRVASHHVDTEEGKEAFVKLRQNKERDTFLKELRPPPMPSMFFYPEPPIVHPAPPPGSHEPPTGRPQPTEEAQAEGLFLERGDEISPPPSPREKYEELTFGEYVEDIDPEYAARVDCHQNGRWKSAYALALAYSMGMGPCSRVACGFATAVAISEYVWEWVTVNSRLNSHIIWAALDTRKHGYSLEYNPTYAKIMANHIVEFWVDDKLERVWSKEVFSAAITEPEQNYFESYDSNVRIGTEISASHRTLRNKKLVVCELIELVAETDAWARIEGYFTWDPLPTWWRGVTIAQVDLNSKFRLEDIFSP